MTDKLPREEIRRELAYARAALVRDARAAATDARILADWRHHFSAHPWLFCAGAAAIGYALVPHCKTGRRTGPTVPRAQPLLSIDSQPPSAMSLLATGASILAGFAARQAANYLARRGLDSLKELAARQLRGAAESQERREVHDDQSVR